MRETGETTQPVAPTPYKTQPTIHSIRMEANRKWPHPRPLCVESNLITLEEEVFGILSEEKIDTRPLAPSLSLLPLSSPLFLSFSRAAPLRSCCTSNSSNYCYDSDEEERSGGRRPTPLVIPCLAPSSLLAFRSLF